MLNTPYPLFSEQLSKVLWIIAVCQNHGFRATRSILATLLQTNRENISNIINQIKKKNSEFIDGEPIGLRTPEFINQLTDETKAIKEDTGYIIRVDRNISTPNTARIALLLEDLYIKSEFYKETELTEFLANEINISKEDAEQKLKFLFQTNYLELHKIGYVIPAKSNRTKSENIYLTYLATNPNPDFISNLRLRN